MRLLIYLAVNSIAVYIAGYLLPGVEIVGLGTILLVAIVLGVLNTFIKPVLLLLTFPLTILTFGLFTLVINALLILLASAVIPGFIVDNFWWALLFAIILSLVGSFLNSLVD